VRERDYSGNSTATHQPLRSRKKEQWGGAKKEI